MNTLISYSVRLGMIHGLKVIREWRESLGTRDALNISSVAKPDNADH